MADAHGLATAAQHAPHGYTATQMALPTYSRHTTHRGCHTIAYCGWLPLLARSLVESYMASEV